ncbi:uncharacterized protein LOC104896009 isoform X2 [Beta vulgaris subsp. vulgaris]|uniref:uncharacterized protein LOC104896009 isoform X2 n=1 Tax=Beta vulgaris subsp. vulgaris TaxID=3555 RepID=UPI0020369373|nr:uncharacterized protein LOC104896009 isoform X2 [Beta vulgaris subsp. vulgaris]
MFFNGLIQRKLTSLLRPWLTQEPEFEVKLGLFRSLIVAKNLNFDTSALNSLIDGVEEFKLLFRSLTVDQIIVRVAHWSAPAFTVEFNGVNVTLFLEKRAFKRVEESVDDYLEKRKKKILSEIDPDGSTLHDNIENMMTTASSKSRLKDSITNLFLMHCCICLHDARIRVEYPVPEDIFSWSCYSRELNAQSSHKELRCFLGGFIGLFFLPLRETSYDLEASMLEIGAERKDHSSCILSCVNPHFGIRMKGLHLVNSALYVPEMNFSFSPTQLQMMGAFNNLLNIECKHVRSGRLLWGIARCKIRHSLLPPGFMFYSVVLIAVLWLSLVKKYHYYLILVGLSEHGVKMPKDHNFPRIAEQQRKMISQMIEKKLPAEAIASARRVARYKAVLKEPLAEDIAVSPMSSDPNRFWRVIFALAFIWQAPVDLFDSIVSICNQHNISPKDGQVRMTYEVADPSCCFQLSLGKISAAVSFMDASRKSSNMRKRTPYSDVFSIILLVKELLFIYEEGISEQYISCTLGILEVTSAPVFPDSENETSPKHLGDAFRGHFGERLDGPETIVWGEPALMCCHSEEGDTGHGGVPILEQMSGEMELLWKRMQENFGSKGNGDRNPWAICAIHTFSVYPGVKSPDTGFSKCDLMAGKLNIALRYPSVSSIATLSKQVQHALCQYKESESDVAPLHSLRTFEELQENNWSGGLNSSLQEMKMSILKLLPEKHVEVRAVIAGPRVQISVRNEELSSSNSHSNAAYGQNGVNFTVDVHNVEYAIWPTAKSGIAPSKEHQKQNSLESEFFKLEEPVIEGFSRSVNLKYASKGQIMHLSYLKFGGLRVYFEDLVDSNLIQVLLLKPMTAKFSSLRDHLYSFARTAVISSLSLRVAMSEVSGTFYMDEWSVIMQVLESLFSAASTPAAGYSLRAVQNHLDISENQVLQTGPISEEMLIEVIKEEALTYESAFCFISVSFQLAPFEIILHNSRNEADRRYFAMLFEAYNIQNLGLAELPNCGIWLSIQKTCIDVSLGEAKVEANANFHEFHAIMFRYRNQAGDADKSEIENAIIQSADCMHEFSLSSCTFNLLLNCLNNTGAQTRSSSETSNSDPQGLLSSSSLIIDSLNSKQIQDQGSESNVSASMPSDMLLLNITIVETFMGTCSIKNGLFRADPTDKLYLSLSIGGESIILGIQGGRIYIEMAVLAGFAHCLASYFQYIRSLLFMNYSNRKPMEAAEGSSNGLGREHIEESTETKTSVVSCVQQKLLEAFSVNVSRLSLVLLVTDDSRVVKEIIGSVGLTSKLWLENRKKKFFFNLSRLDILSLILDEGKLEPERSIQMPHFSSVGSSQNSLWLNHENSTGSVPHVEKTSVLSKDASYSSPLESMKSSFTDSSASPVVQSSESAGNYILEQLATSISAEKSISGDDNGPYCSTQGWVGNGTVSGLNLTISLSDIQMLLAIVESLSEVSWKGAASNVEERSWTLIYQESEKDLEAALPDGAIVAIQDVHQHMYVTVESVDNKYKVGGKVHYSLAGKKALFRVKWRKRRIWNSSASWFSLMSLYAKSDSGTPLYLNYSRSSGFVDISSNDDNAHALWKIASCKQENFEDDVNLDPINHLCENTFYLVNKKNDCGAAFVHGALEFVKNPGNPFKFKIFHDLLGVPDSRMSDTLLPEAHGVALLEAQDISEEAAMVPCISLSIEKVSLIIVHELSDSEEKLPLLQGSMDSTDVIIQMLPQKTRVMSTLTAMFYYFDVHRIIWREFVQPIETCFYWRSTSPSQVTGISDHGTLSRLYIRIQELDLSLTELLLDKLLYVVGKLDLAGPFDVRKSAVLVNCCKVENQLDLDLLCHFHNNQSARVKKKQSAFFFLRHLEEPQGASYATVLLENPGLSSTSSVHVPLSGSQIFAWRTRIISQQDSRTGPGPFIVFDISKNAEEGLSLNVSPLLRIHNNTGFPVELRIQRPESMDVESASVLLRDGDTIDDCMAAFDAISLTGGPKKALLSLGAGNFVFSFRPEIKEERDSCTSCSVEWSGNLKGEKAVRLSGVIDKLSYQVRKTFLAESWKYSFSTVGCSVRSGDTHVAQMHFLVQSITRDVPIMRPNDRLKSKSSSIALQEQKELFLLPTVRVSNLLESDIDVLLTETEISVIDGLKNINQATVQGGCTVDLYANPAVLFFNITLATFSSSCKPVNCSQWLKKLNKKKDGIQFLDIDLEFCGGMYFACLRLARGNRGMLEATIFTQYTLRNDTGFLLFCAAPHHKPLSRDAGESYAITTPPQFGTLLPPKSTRSWFMKSSKLCMELLDEESPKSILDLDAISGLAEIKFNRLQGAGIKYLVKLGISLGPLMSKIDVPAQMVSVAPRYIIFNESDEQLFVRQCFLEDDFGETVRISSKQKAALSFRVASYDKRDITFLEKLLQKHKVSDDDASFFVQFSPDETVGGWSGPVCVASLGCFFLKFKRNVEPTVHQLDPVTREDDITWEFAAVHVVEEGPAFVLHFCRPPDTCLPYRIENHLRDASITYYQKDSFQPETLASGGSVNYVWDNLTRPHKLIVKINGVQTLREISLDKLRTWKSFFRVGKQRALPSHLPVDTRASDRRGTNLAQMNGIDVENVGYEVYVDGPTRVLRISHSPGRRNADSKYQSCMKIQFRISYLAIRLLEPCKQLEDLDPYDLPTYTPFIIGRLDNISIDSIIIDQRIYSQIRVQSMHVDEKWAGAPFAAMLRRHLTSNNFTDDSILYVVFVLFPATSSIRDVRYSSIILQPIDLNLDEETLMKIVPFWRASLSSNTQSQQYYFDHFEIHPVKITASFLPVDSYSNYNSGQEALRSLLHSVIKIPAIKNLEVELNGILVTHALVTTRELLLRCARHYSWYGMRAIYIAKGSSLLPPTFASAFDDLASSSLDVFFDPSSSLFNVRGLTLGTFKLISKSIEDKGFSGTKRYFGDLSKTLKNAGSNILFAAVTEISDSVLKGAESSGFNGMVTGFHHGILRIAMEPSLLGTAFLEGGPDRRIKLDRSPGIDELYVEGYLQAMLDAIYKQEYLRVRVVDDQVILKNLPPNSSLIDEIVERVKDFLISKALLKGDFSTSSRPLRHLRGENEWRVGPIVLTLCEHLFVSFTIRMLRKQTDKATGKLKLKERWVRNHADSELSSSAAATSKEPKEGKSIWRWGFGKFILSAMVAYVDGRLCRCIPNPVARRIVSGFLLSFLDNNDKSK